MKALFQGMGVALATPFTAEGINLDALDELIDFQLLNGAAALVACGTTGEPSTMTEKEIDSVIAATVARVNGRVPVIAGTGGNDTRKTMAAAKRAKALGADAQLCVTPYYNKTTQKGLIAHYTALAEEGSLPVIIYNVPARTGLNMLPGTLKALCAHENIIAMKEASGDIAQCADMVRLCGEDLAFYSGNDDVVLPSMALGFDGVISVAGNIVPKEMSELVKLCLNGDFTGARKLQFKLDPLIDALFSEVNPIPIKTALNLIGFHMGAFRLPLCDMEETHLALMKNEMKKVGLI